MVTDILHLCVSTGLRSLSPFMPFLTEELYQRLPGVDLEITPSVSLASYPRPEDVRTFTLFYLCINSTLELVIKLWYLWMSCSTTIGDSSVISNNMSPTPKIWMVAPYDRQVQSIPLKCMQLCRTNTKNSFCYTVHLAEYRDRRRYAVCTRHSQPYSVCQKRLLH